MKNIKSKDKIIVSVCIPTYNSENTIAETIRSVLNQSEPKYEIVIIDDNSKDGTVNKIRSIKDNRIRLMVNKKNLGCGKNLQKCKDKAKGDIVVFLAGDDLLDRNALKNIRSAFRLSKDVGVVVRPYFWFIGNNLTPVRITRQFKNNQLVSLRSKYKKIIDVIALSDQMSGISFRKKYLNFPFSNQPFVEMGEAVMRVLKVSKAAIIKDNILAVRIANNGSMNPSVYKNSPMEVWKSAIDNSFPEKRFNGLREFILKNFIAVNYVGLIQIKNYGTYKQLLREINLLIKYRIKNLITPKFYFFTLISLVIPPSILIKIVKFYKKTINSKNIKIDNFILGV